MKTTDVEYGIQFRQLPLPSPERECVTLVVGYILVHLYAQTARSRWYMKLCVACVFVFFFENQKSVFLRFYRAMDA